MPNEVTEVLWLDHSQQLSLADMADLSGLTVTELQSLADFGVIVPTDLVATEWTFHASCLVMARTACRLRSDFDLDEQALSLTLALLQRIDGLELQLRELRAQVPSRKH